MLILGIETSCDETAASLLEVRPVKFHKAKTPKGLFDGIKIKVLSNIISSQIKLHAPFGGVVPSLAAREHVKNLPKVIKLALQACKPASLQAVDLIAVTHGPGLISSLLVGTAFAKTLAWKYNKPIVGVNHLEGHLASNWLGPVGEISNFQFPISKKNLKSKLQIPNPKKIPKLETRNQKLETKLFPAMCLIVSGGHTELVLMKKLGQYKIVGQTLDDAGGEAFDKIARILGLGYPGGPAIAAEAAKLVASNWFLVSGKKQPVASNQQLVTKLPRPMLNSKSLDFSFSGLKTAVLYLVRDLGSSTKTMTMTVIAKDTRIAIAAEAQQAIVDVLIAKTIRAAQQYKAKSIMLSGGVSANKLLRLELEKAAGKQGLKFFRPEMEYTTDNAAMISLAGYLNLMTKKKARLSWQSVNVDANLTIS